VAARFLLIDGYNLLHAAGMARRSYGPGDLQRCRERLLRHLVSHLTAAEIGRALVVFDAREPPPDRPANQIYRGLRILFANPGGDADVVIQESLAEHRAPRQLTLISSDHVLQQAARRQQAKYLDSEAFLAELERRRERDRRKSAPESDEKPADHLTPAEAEHWLRAFGDLSDFTADASSRDQPDDIPSADDHRASISTEARTSDEHTTGMPTESTPRSARSSKRAKERATGPKKRGPPPASQDKRGGGAHELEFWMQVFRGLPEAAELSRGQTIDLPLPKGPIQPQTGFKPRRKSSD
jgi:predicted RNA-binding protein with PIN domain